MTRRVRDTSAREKRLRDAGAREPRLEPAALAKALGAKHVGNTTGRSLVTMPGLDQELAARLRSTGGRPALEGTTRRQKIPLTEEDWNQLERLSKRLRATPGQIASALLHRLLADLDIDEKAAALLKKKA